MGGNCFALFLGSQRSWKRPALDHKAATKFEEQRSLHEIDPAHVLPHGSYLMNCGSPKPGFWPVDVSELCTNSVLCQFSIISLLKRSLLIFTDSTLSPPPRCVWEESGHAGGWTEPLQPPGSHALQLPPRFFLGLDHHWAVCGKDSRSHQPRSSANTCCGHRYQERTKHASSSTVKGRFNLRVLYLV